MRNRERVCEITRDPASKHFCRDVALAVHLSAMQRCSWDEVMQAQAQVPED